LLQAYSSRPYYDAHGLRGLQPAYNYALLNYDIYRGKSFDEVEADLAPLGPGQGPFAPDLGARQGSDARCLASPEQRVERAVPGDSDTTVAESWCAFDGGARRALRRRLRPTASLAMMRPT